MMAWASCEIDLAFDASSFFPQRFAAQWRKRWKTRLFLLILSSPVHFQKKIFFSATVKASLKISLGLEFRWVD
jgi:hypothetical protein